MSAYHHTPVLCSTRYHGNLAVVPTGYHIIRGSRPSAGAESSLHPTPYRRVFRSPHSVRPMPTPSSPVSTSPQGFLRERYDSLKQISRAGGTSAALVIGWLLLLGGYQTLVNDWLPPLYATIMPKPYQAVDMIWSFLSVRSYLAIAGLVLCGFSFEDYHRNRVGRKSITPVFLLLLAVTCFTFAIVQQPLAPTSPQKAMPPSGEPSKQEENLRSLTVAINKLQALAALQVTISNLTDKSERLSSALLDVENIAPQYIYSCTLKIPKLPDLVSRYVLQFSVNSGTPVNTYTEDQHFAQISGSVDVPFPNLDINNTLDISKPAPGQDLLSTDEAKYDYRVAFWKCKAAELGFTEIKRLINQKLRSVDLDLKNANQSLRMSTFSTSPLVFPPPFPARPTLPAGR